MSLALASLALSGVGMGINAYQNKKARQAQNVVPEQPMRTSGGSWGYKYGGKMKKTKKYPMGGQLPITQPMGQDAEKFVGPSHEQGGIPIDKSGKPTKDRSKAIAEVEGGETKDGDIIFSDTLIVPELGVTFAEAHEMLMAEGATDQDIQELAQMQEQVKMEEGVSDEMPQEQMAEQIPQEGMVAQEPMQKMPYGGRLGTNTYLNTLNNKLQRPEVRPTISALPANRPFNIKRGETNKQLAFSPQRARQYGETLPPAKAPNNFQGPPDSPTNMYNPFMHNRIKRGVEEPMVYAPEIPTASPTANRQSSTQQARTSSPYENYGRNTSFNPQERMTSPTTRDNYSSNARIDSMDRMESPLQINRSNQVTNPQRVETTRPRNTNRNNFDKNKALDLTQRYLPSAIEAGIALHPSMKPEMLEAETFRPENVRTSSTPFNSARRDIRGSARTAIEGGGSADRVHAQTIKGMSNVAEAEGQNRLQVDNQNTQSRNQASQFNIQNRQQVDAANKQAKAQHRAKQIGMLTNAVTRPINMARMDKVGQQSQIAEIMASAGNFENEAMAKNHIVRGLKAMNVDQSEIDRILKEYKYGGKLKKK